MRRGPAAAGGFMAALVRGRRAVRKDIDPTIRDSLLVCRAPCSESAPWSVVAGIANDEGGRRSCRDVERTGGRIEGRSLAHVIGARPLHGMQSHAQIGRA